MDPRPTPDAGRGKKSLRVDMPGNGAKRQEATNRKASSPLRVGIFIYIGRRLKIRFLHRCRRNPRTQTAILPMQKSGSAGRCGEQNQFAPARRMEICVLYLYTRCIYIHCGYVQYTSHREWMEETSFRPLCTAPPNSKVDALNEWKYINNYIELSGPRQKNTPK
jgi:hypothetical protein